MWRRLASLTTLVVTLEEEEGASMEALEETEEVEVLETMDIDPTTTEAITGDLEEVSDHHQGEVDPVVVAGVKDGWTTTMITKQQAQRDEGTTTEKQQCSHRQHEKLGLR